MAKHQPRRALRGGISKVNFEQSLSSFGNTCPQNGSKNEPRAPRTSLGYPHIGPFVVRTSVESHKFRFKGFVKAWYPFTNLKTPNAEPETLDTNPRESSKEGARAIAAGVPHLKENAPP